MLAFLAAALAASTQSPAASAPLPSPAAEAPALESPVLESGVPWWERITVTVDDKGEQQSCKYEMSLSAKGAEACDEEMADSVRPSRSSGQTGRIAKLTYERRFSPGRELDAGRLQPGDTLLGRQVMFLTLDKSGSIESCHVVATSGDVPPDYDCDEARKEQFKAQAGADPGERQAFMTILAYGHQEQIA